MVKNGVFSHVVLLSSPLFHSSNGVFIASILYSLLRCGLITAAALLHNSRIIMSFIVLIRVSVRMNLSSIFTVPLGTLMEVPPSQNKELQVRLRVYTNIRT